MDTYVAYHRASQPQFPTRRQTQSGYEPSDSETEWDKGLWLERKRNNSDFSLPNPDSGLDQTGNKSLSKQKTRSFSRYEDEPSCRKGVQARNKRLQRSTSRYENEPLSQNGELRHEKANLGSDQTRNRRSFILRRRHSTNFHDEVSPQARDLKESPPSRKHSNSHCKLFEEDSPFQNVSQFGGTVVRKNVAPYKPVRKKYDLVYSETVKSKCSENQSQTNKVWDKKGGYDQFSENSRASEKLNYNLQSRSASRSRYSHAYPMPGIKEGETSSRNTPLAGELNETVANFKISRTGATNFESTESISEGDIFFSREYINMKMATQNYVFPNKENGSRVYDSQKNLSNPVTRRTNMASNNSFINRQSSDKLSTTANSKLNAISMSSEKFMLCRKMSQAEAWFACLKSRTCRTSKSMKKVKEFDEASFIGKAFVVESLRQFWADKHQPASLDEVICHKQEAQSLKLLVSHDICPHILLKGPRGSGKKALTIALLRTIYGDSAHNISHDMRYFSIQRSRPVQVVVPLRSSAHHVELNAYSEPNIGYALISLVKEISNNFATTPEVSLAVGRTDYKVIVLYDADKATEKLQHLLKWIMDCYTESCKLILCCEDDKDILDSVKNRCQLVDVDAPATHDIMEVLNQIARKEDFDLPLNFAAKIANKSRQNLRQAIMALEACKAYNYPFINNQPIPLGWEDIVENLAAEILADPSHSRIFSIRGRFQKLLVECVHPKLILQKVGPTVLRMDALVRVLVHFGLLFRKQGLVEQFLKAIEGTSKRELYYWHAYYEKRLPAGSSALLKLEEFVAKFMSMHRRGISINKNIPSLTA